MCFALEFLDLHLHNDIIVILLQMLLVRSIFYFPVNASLTDYRWESLCNKINDSSVIPSDYQNMFDNFNNNVKLNTNAEEDFTGVFNDINLGDSRLGATTTARAKALSNIVKLVDEIEYMSEDGRDILG